jgi:ribosome-binding protein aMBF1 (putative translation factor)
MGSCERCSISSGKVKLFDAIYEGRMVSLCERCSIIENMPIIKKPDALQLKESEEAVGVYDRMKKLSGLRAPEKEETYFQEDRLNELEKHPELELPEREKLNLLDHFHWDVMKCRRKKGLSQKQLAEAIGESEIAIQMMEKARLPENAEIMIRKLEQFFQVKLKKISETERLMNFRKMQEEPVLLNEQGQELEIIPEEEPVIISEEGSEEDLRNASNNEIKLESECKVESFDSDKQKMTCESIEKKIEPEIPRLNSEGDLDLRRTNAERVTIKELQDIHQKKVEVTRQEQIEEQKKIEERKRILEALREQDRIKFEERKKQEMFEKQKQEQERQRLLNDQRRAQEQVKEQEFQDIDKHLGGVELLGKNSDSIENKNYIKEFDDELI